MFILLHFSGRDERLDLVTGGTIRSTSSMAMVGLAKTFLHIGPLTGISHKNVCSAKNIVYSDVSVGPTLSSRAPSK